MIPWILAGAAVVFLIAACVSFAVAWFAPVFSRREKIAARFAAAFSVLGMFAAVAGPLVAAWELLS